ncbi:uncharacterized protein EAE97_002885 [Botrytis byssoidea]|uniref:F-box domain-containing protein n=1 Tax=Botrytis byssoidea TaxID=139641 RepID=A0A9P5IWJ5_9HELO|nr:uncharacterized protein EAE97_002885 [Botrytis byssoidea]KAF7949376.1 hypothetical protein EAE97_002885 [Botrytis byssoidea]
MENEKYLHGGLDPGIESTVQLVEAVESPDMSSFFSSQEALSSELSQSKNAAFPGIKPPIEIQLRLARLPVEILRQVSSYLSPCDLINLGKSCKILYDITETDSLWRHLVQENVPGIKLNSPFPCESFKKLYQSHDPHWFLTKNKLWFGDSDYYGQLMISKYNPENGSIGLYRLLTQRSTPQFCTWKDDTSVVIHCFDPRTHLATCPQQLDLHSYSHRSLSDTGHAERRLKGEVPLKVVDRGNSSRECPSRFLLSKLLVGNQPNRPQANKWPPPKIPAKFRADRPTIFDNSCTATWGRPESRSQINEKSFRIRGWMEMNGLVQIGDQIQTYSTLDFELYTPTEDKPYRGIFVGDYSGHGCEYLLLDQRDGTQKQDEPNISKLRGESHEAWEARKRQARTPTGSLCAIKLTGDPNIPRGEITWVADDISDKGLVRYGEKDWPGARIVRSRGQIANQGYKNPKYIETELIMISPDVLAQHWVPFGHISFFHRVDIDSYVNQ